jgi:hypothetical protein
VAPSGELSQVQRGRIPPSCGVLVEFCLVKSRVCFCSSEPRESAVEYKQLIVKAFEQAAGKWRASVKRSDGKPLMIVGRAKLAQFVTGLDSVTANDALLMAVAAIDAGAFSCRAPLAPTSSGRREIEGVTAGAPSSRSGGRSLPPVGWPRPSTVASSTFAAAVRPRNSSRPAPARSRPSR